jgi:hypothetical protein
MSKRDAFNRTFSEPVDFLGGSYAVSAELYPTIAEAAVAMDAYFSGECTNPDDFFSPVDGAHVKLEWVRFGFSWAGEYGWPQWWTGATPNKPRSKPVWMFAGEGLWR